MMIVIGDDWKNEPVITTTTKTIPAIIYAPLVYITPTYDEIYARPQFDPCRNCSNNPRNNPLASGVCHCALPSMYQITY